MIVKLFKVSRKLKIDRINPKTSLLKNPSFEALRIFFATYLNKNQVNLNKAQITRLPSE
jgi:hypothetical protein